jgi:hypothetical protein
MECERLIRLMKDWYLRVKQETMAPVRMMQFVDRHISTCEVCQADQALAAEIEKIREFVVPESKIPKAVRDQHDRPTPDISPDEDELDDEERDEENENDLDEDELDSDEDDEL